MIVTECSEHVAQLITCMILSVGVHVLGVALIELLLWYGAYHVDAVLEYLKLWLNLPNILFFGFLVP